MVSLLSFPRHMGTLREGIALLTRHRQLTMEMARREIADRYLGQVFGHLLGFGHPFMLMVVYVFVFAYRVQSTIGGTEALPLDYTTYLLPGLIPWLSFQERWPKTVWSS